MPRKVKSLSSEPTSSTKSILEEDSNPKPKKKKKKTGDEQKLLDALETLKPHITEELFLDLKSKINPDDIGFKDITNVQWDCKHFSMIKSFLAVHLKSSTAGSEELLHQKIVDSRVAQGKIEYLLIPKKDSTMDKGKWFGLENLKSSIGAHLVELFENSQQFKLTKAFYDRNKDDIASKFKQPWLGIGYDRVIYEGESRLAVMDCMKSEKDILPWGGIAVEKGKDILIPRSSKKVRRTQMNFGPPGRFYNPGKRIPKPDNTNFEISSPRRTRHVDLQNVMLDTGCDLTELDTQTVRQLQLPQNYQPHQSVVNGEECCRYPNCILTIGNQEVVLDVVESQDDENLLGRNVYNAFGHDVNPKTNRHTWLGQ